MIRGILSSVNGNNGGLHYPFSCMNWDELGEHVKRVIRCEAVGDSSQLILEIKYVQEETEGRRN